MSFAGVAVGVVSLVVSVGSGINNARKAETAARDEANTNRYAAMVEYARQVNTASLQRRANEETATNAVQEVHRAGGAQQRELEGQIDSVVSTTHAQSEGLTSGNTKGREMISIYRKSNKVLQKSNNQKSTSIIAIMDQKNQNLNKINMGQLQAGEDAMAAMLTGQRSTKGYTGWDAAGDTLGAVSTGLAVYSATK